MTGVEDMIDFSAFSDEFVKISMVAKAKGAKSFLSRLQQGVKKIVGESAGSASYPLYPGSGIKGALTRGRVS